MAGAQGMGLGLSIPDVAGRTRGVPDPAAAALIARMSVAPDAARSGLIDAAVRAIKAAGVWAKLEALWLMAAHDAQAARLNWVSSSYSLSAVNSPAFTADRGYAGDGATRYLDTNLTPGTSAMQADSCAIGVWSRTDADNAGCAMGGASSNSIYIFPRNAGDFAARLNNSTSATAAVADSLGLFAANRSASNAVQLYRNGASAGSSAGTVVGRPTVPLFLLARNNGGMPNAHDTRQLAMAFVAKASMSAGEHAALHAALAAYLIAVGAA